MALWLAIALIQDSFTEERKVGSYPEGIDSEVFGSLVFSPDRRSIAFMARKGSDSHVILGDRIVASAPGDDVRVGGYLPDSRFLYAVETRGAAYVSVGGEKGEKYDQVRLPFVRRGKPIPRVAYAALRGGKWHLIDGKNARTFEEISNLSFASDRYLAYAVRSGTRWSCGVDAWKDDREFEEISWIQLDKEGRPYAIVARREGKWLVCAGNVEYENYEHISYLSYDLESNTLAFTAARGGAMKNWFGSKVYSGGKHWLEVSGLKHGSDYDEIGQPVLSSTGRFAHAARTGAKWMAVVDGSPGPAFEDVNRYGIVFSADGKRVAYAANVGGKYNETIGIVRGGVDWLVVDHKKVAEKVWPFGIAFSPDGSRILYCERPQRGKKVLVSLTGSEATKGSVVDEIYWETLQFSADGRHAGYVARIGREFWWKVLSIRP